MSGVFRKDVVASEGHGEEEYDRNYLHSLVPGSGLVGAHGHREEQGEESLPQFLPSSSSSLWTVMPLE